MTDPPSPLAEFAETTIFLTGATGFLGRTTLAALRAHLPPSTKLISCSRRPATRRDDGIELVQCDLSRDSLPIEHLLQSDYIIWMAACRDHAAPFSRLWHTNVKPILATIDILRGSRRLQRLIYVSSISAIDQPDHQPAPIDDMATPSPMTGYGHSKLLAETALRASGLPVTILRLPFLYGPDFGMNSFLAWYASMARRHRWRRVALSGQLSLLHTGDFAAICLEVLKRRNRAAADASPYAVSDGAFHCVDDLIDRIADALGEPSRPRQFPSFVSHWLYWLLSATRLRYWRHAAFHKVYFTLTADRFHKAFPDLTFADCATKLPECFGAQLPSRQLPYSAAPYYADQRHSEPARPGATY